MRFMSKAPLAVMVCAVVVLGVGESGPVVAQTSQDKAPLKASVPLKAEVVISRFQGDKKVSAAPFTLWLNAVDSRLNSPWVSVRMGMDVPVGTRSETRPTSENAKTTTTTEGANYRYVGTSIDAAARQADDGRYLIDLRVQESAVFTGDDRTPFKPGEPLAFRSFTMNNALSVRPGQATEFATATDRLTGETLRVDVTITIVK